MNPGTKEKLKAARIEAQDSHGGLVRVTSFLGVPMRNLFITGVFAEHAAKTSDPVKAIRDGLICGSNLPL